MTSNANLDGSVAIVTGGGSGIGRATATLLASRGAAVALCDIDRQLADQAAAEAAGVGGQALGHVVDIRDDSAVRRFVEDTVAVLGGVDILVNAAGVQRYGTVEETNHATWAEVIATNLTAVYVMSRTVIPHMRRRGGGAIVNVSSLQSTKVQKGIAAYAASKGGLEALTRAMAIDHAGDGIRVTAVCPGAVDTPLLRNAAELFAPGAVEAFVAQSGQLHPIGRIAQPSEVAELIAFLAGPNAGFITGSIHVIDGGLGVAILGGPSTEVTE